MEYKKVRKMYFTCNSCGESNEKVKVYNSFDTTLCRRCYLKFLKSRKENEIESVKEVKSIEEWDISNINNNEPTYNEEGKIMCNICGEHFNNLGLHVHYSHGISIKQYRQIYGYDDKVSLIGKDLYKKCVHRLDHFNNKKKAKDNNKQLEIEV